MAELKGTLEPGIYPDVPEHTYRAWDTPEGVANQSILKLFSNRTPAHALHAILNPKATAATDIGGAIHAVAEGSDVSDEYAVRPPGIDRRTKLGKADWAAFLERSEGKIVLEKPDVYDMLTGIEASIRRHPLAHRLLTAPGLTEVSAIWRDPDFDVLCKGRMDRIVDIEGWTWVVDVKSTEDAGPKQHQFGRSVNNFGYYVQAAFYLDGLNIISPRERRFVCIAIEKKAPYEIAYYELDSIYYEAGREEYRQNLAAWKECKRTGVWPGYPDSIQTMEAPQWLEKRLVGDGGV